MNRVVPSRDPSVVALRDGHTIPVIGFGTYAIADPALLVRAIETGYRLLDTASSYGNEREVGEAVASSPVPRNELFVTTKLRGRDQGREKVRPALEASLARLRLDYVDLFLIHWPLPRLGAYVESWEAMIDLRDAGLIRSIGVSNFLPEHLDRLVAETGEVPVVNQIELHPYLPQEEQRAYHSAHRVLTQSWSPLGRKSSLLQEGKLADIAAKHDASTAQVVLAWHRALGAVPIPKSSTPSRFADNLTSVGLELDADDLEAIATLADGKRIGGDPSTHEEF
jgi:2,5-diketo-D-gluconate reductase A